LHFPAWIMKKEAVILLAVIVLIIFMAGIMPADVRENEIEKQIAKDGKASVIVIIEKSKFLQQNIENFKINHKFSETTFAVEVDEKDYEKLVKQGIRIRKEKIFSISLQDSAPLVNATLAWSLQQEVNLTGINQTICILDTGINYTHPDLGGCFGNNNATSNCKVMGGYDFVNGDSDPIDDHGHGTHVAGIAAANGSINGIAPGAKIVALKVLNSAGSGSEANIDAGIDWCVGNSSLFNISVISISIGDNENYTGYCDENYTGTITTAINAAVAKNISVVIASGNNYNFTTISGPACIQNATPVAALNKDNSMASYSNRNSLVLLVAPGTNINSTRLGSCPGGCSCAGNYMICSGTSMATPHVAGAIAIINQFLRISHQTKTSEQIESILNSTGTLVFDSSSRLNFSRINIYEAILAFDNLAPNVSLISPSNNQINMTQNQAFFCNATDIALKNVTFYLWNSTGIANISRTDVSGRYSSVQFSLSNLPYENYKWNCLFYDKKNNSVFASSNFSLIIGRVLTTLVSPATNNYTNLNNTNFNCSSQSETNSNLANVTFYLWNSSALIYNLTRNVSGIYNSTIFNYNFSQEDNYKWSCLSINNNSNSFLAANSTITYDVTKPSIILISPDDATSSETGAYNFTFNVSDNYNISECYLIFDGRVINLNTASTTQTNGMYNSSLGTGSHTWSINCTDLAGNLNNSASRSLTVTSSACTSCGGGGGGGGSSYSTYSISENQVEAGYTQNLKKDDRIKFIAAGENHILKIKNLALNNVEITIESNPVSLTLSVGDEKKINLDNDEYFDLYLKLNSIISDKANITLRSIHEKEKTFTIQENAAENNESLMENITNTNNNVIEKITNNKQEKKNYLYVIIPVLIVIGIILILSKRKKHKKRK